jgi:hypothetical protein
MALNGALDKGHPEAYLAMSRALFEGILYSRDPVMAFAYARAAELEAMSNHIILRGLDDQKSAVSQYLDNGQLAEAEGLVQQLRRGPGG